MFFVHVPYSCQVGLLESRDFVYSPIFCPHVFYNLYKNPPLNFLVNSYSDILFRKWHFDSMGCKNSCMLFCFPHSSRGTELCILYCLPWRRTEANVITTCTIICNLNVLSCKVCTCARYPAHTFSPIVKTFPFQISLRLLHFIFLYSLHTKFSYSCIVLSTAFIYVPIYSRLSTFRNSLDNLPLHSMFKVSAGYKRSSSLIFFLDSYPA